MEITTVIKSYQKQYLDPIQLNVGDIVVLGKEETEEKWIGWIWAETKNNSGWIPIQIVFFSEDKKTGVILEYYSASELSIDLGDKLQVLKSLNGWLWVKNLETNEEGWIPSECIKIN